MSYYVGLGYGTTTGSAATYTVCYSFICPYCRIRQSTTKQDGNKCLCGKKYSIRNGFPVWKQYNWRKL